MDCPAVRQKPLALTLLGVLQASSFIKQHLTHSVGFTINKLEDLQLKTVCSPEVGQFAHNLIHVELD